MNHVNSGPTLFCAFLDYRNAFDYIERNCQNPSRVGFVFGKGKLHVSPLFGLLCTCTVHVCNVNYLQEHVDTSGVHIWSSETVGFYCATCMQTMLLFFAQSREALTLHTCSLSQYCKSGKYRARFEIRSKLLFFDYKK